MYRLLDVTIADNHRSGRITSTIAGYYAATRAMDIEAWVCAFARDAVIHNPVGAIPAVGHQGLRDLWASMTGALDHMGLTEERVYVTGRRAAVGWTGRGVGWNGRSVVFDGIDVFEMDHNGKIHTLWSYWYPGVLRAQLHAGP